VAAACAGDYDTALEAAEAALDLRPSLALAWIHYANVLGHKKLKDRAQQALEQCKKINPAMTPKHYESLVKRMSRDKILVEHRLGGLRNIGALRRSKDE
jgi:predicted Zn-dependent protease